MKKNHKVVMLPTDEASHLGIYTDITENTRLYYKDNQTIHFKEWKPQHIYFTSDEDIKEGDWCYDSLRNCIWKKSKNITCNGEIYKKIIATTDKSLTWEHDDTVPYPKTRSTGIELIPKDFIKLYAERGGIDEVEVKYESGLIEPCPNCGDNLREQSKGQCLNPMCYRGQKNFKISKLKLDNNNEVIWSLVEDKVECNVCKQNKYNAKNGIVGFNGACTCKIGMNTAIHHSTLLPTCESPTKEKKYSREEIKWDLSIVLSNIQTEPDLAIKQLIEVLNKL